MSEIGQQIRLLEKERREYQKKVMKEYDDEYYTKLRILRNQCEHNFKFSHLGPIGHVWFYCSICGKSKVEDPDKI